ncbi:MAG: hypothetical protein HY236_10435 [Acidobacteria bacterium]|nr:hypothetical protein [Acidobacteriota bacterium]
MAKKTDPLNRKKYGAVTVNLNVVDVKAAASFYQKAFGFKKRGISNGPDGKPMSLYLYVENADKVFARAVKLGATARMPVTDMFWGDRCGNVIDPEGHPWAIATHIAEPTPREMKKKMAEQMAAMQSSAAGA